MIPKNIGFIDKSNSKSRRDFLRSTAAAVAATGSACLLPSLLPEAAAAEKKKESCHRCPSLGVRSAAPGV